MRLLTKLTNMFPGKVTTFEKFLNLLNKHKCVSVIATIIVTTEGPSDFLEGAGMVGKFVYSATYVGINQNGKEIQLLERYLERFGSESNKGDQPERTNAALRIFHTVDTRLKAIEQRFPDNTITTKLYGNDGLFEDDTIEDLRALVARCKIVPFEPIL